MDQDREAEQGFRLLAKDAKLAVEVIADHLAAQPREIHGAAIHLQQEKLLVLGEFAASLEQDQAVRIHLVAPPGPGMPERAVEAVALAPDRVLHVALDFEIHDVARDLDQRVVAGGGFDREPELGDVERVAQERELGVRPLKPPCS